MRKVVKLHGTCGSGKSTIARRFMEEARITIAIQPEGARRPEAYQLDMQWDKPLYIIGPYVSECGGMDALDSDTCVELLEKYGALDGHVFYESMIASGFYGRMGKVSEAWGDDHIFAFMTTPLEECIRRTEQRRLKRGNTKPLDPKNVIWKHEAMLKLYAKLNGPLARKTVQVASYEDVKALYVGPTTA